MRFNRKEPHDFFMMITIWSIMGFAFAMMMIIQFTNLLRMMSW